MALKDKVEKVINDLFKNWDDMAKGIHHGMRPFPNGKAFKTLVISVSGEWLNVRIDANLIEIVSGWVMWPLKSGLLEFGGERSSFFSSSTSQQLTTTQLDSNQLNSLC